MRGKRRELRHGRVMSDVLVSVGDHCAPSIPAAFADDVYLGCKERVGSSDDCADVEVVLPVFDRDVEGVASGVEISNDRLLGPVAIAVQDVTAVPVGEQLGVEPSVGRPRFRVRANTNNVARAFLA